MITAVRLQAPECPDVTGGYYSTDWLTVEGWCQTPFNFGLPTNTKARKLTRLDNMDLSKPADAAFWVTFPSGGLPTFVTSGINIAKFAELIDEAKLRMTIHEKDMASKALDIHIVPRRPCLPEGAPDWCKGKKCTVNNAMHSRIH